MTHQVDECEFVVMLYPESVSMVCRIACNVLLLTVIGSQICECIVEVSILLFKLLEQT